MSDDAAAPELGIDIELGARVCNAEKYGDWYRDPWGWPEYIPEFAKEITIQDLGIEKQERKYNYRVTPVFHVFDVPKSYLGVRPAVVQDVRTRLAYTSAVASVAPRLHDGLPDWVFGWRARGGQLAKSVTEWDLYKSSQQGVAGSPFAAQTDITSFFATIEPARILDALTQKIGRGVVVQIVDAVLSEHNKLATRRGLPQRSTASSILAQLAITAIDDLLAAELSSGSIQAARRWMDDISFEGPEEKLYGLLLRIQDHARRAGLELNHFKTHLLIGQTSAEWLANEAERLIRIAPVATLEDSSADLSSTVFDETALLEAEERVLSDPTGASRSFAGLVLRSLIHYKNFARASEWMDAAHHLPHAADNLGRYLSAATEHNVWTWLAIEDWFAETNSSTWPHLDWVAAQHALAVPSHDLTETGSAVLRAWLASSASIQKVAVAVQRLAALDPTSTRVSVTDRLDSTGDPLLVRLLALGLVASGGSKDIARSALARHDQNFLTLKYLESRDWKLPKPAADFDPSDEPN